MGHTFCVEALIDEGASVNAVVFVEEGYGGGRRNNTALSNAIHNGWGGCAERLLDRGAKINLAQLRFQPPWWQRIVAKHSNVRRSVLAFVGVLRKRRVFPLQLRVPKDMVNVLSDLIWRNRFDPLWTHANLTMAATKASCKHSCKNKGSCRHLCCRQSARN